MFKSVIRFFFHYMPRPLAGLSNVSTRDNWVKEKLLSLPNGFRLLDAGAGECQYKKYCKHLDYVSQDFSQYDGVGNQEGLQTGVWDTSNIDIVCDITNIPCSDNSFDAILCTEVLEHLPDPICALKEFSRVLKPNGVLILTAPFVSMTHFAPYHYSTGFNRYFYEYHLPDLGFYDIEILENGNYFEFMAQELRRLPQMAQEFASVKVWFGWRLIIYIIIFYLDELSFKDSGSKKMLNFDLQVTATKVG
jgi:ubiquinone/menaquinone biosynthesis C-methylase UbiE